MVGEIFTRLFKERVEGLHEAAFLLASFALLSKFLALIRDRLLAHSFGANIDLDIYYAAFRIPDFLYASLASLVAGAVLIPFIVEKLKTKSEAQRFFNQIFTVFFFLISIISALVFFMMPALSDFIIPGLLPEAKNTLVELSRIMLLSPILLGLSGLFASVTQSLRHFLNYALTPVLYNVGIIGGIVFLYPTFGLSGLAYGVVLGALFHMLIQIPVLIRHAFIPRMTPNINWNEIRNIFFLSLPRTITLSAHHLTILVLIAFASFMDEGSISIFNFSFNLQSVPLSIIGVSYSMAAFPTLVDLYSNGKREAFVGQVVAAMRHIIFWSFPIMVLFIVLRAQIVRTVLGTGEFDWADTRLTAAALALFISSAVAQGLMLLLVRGYYAAHQTLKPLLINVSSLAVIIACAYLLRGAFAESDLFRYFLESLFRIEYLSGSEILVLPLAFSIGVFMNILVLWIFFVKDFHVSQREVLRTMRQIFFSSIIMGFTAHQCLRIFDDVFDINTLTGIFMQGLLSGIAGITVLILVLKLLKNRELEEIFGTLHHKFWKTKPIVPDQEGLSQ